MAKQKPKRLRAACASLVVTTGCEGAAAVCKTVAHCPTLASRRATFFRS